jgi:hypothetical protein
LKGLCPGFGFGPLSPVAYARRAMEVRIGAVWKAFEENWEKGEEDWHTRRETSRGSECAILLTWSDEE